MVFVSRVRWQAQVVKCVHRVMLPLPPAMTQTQSIRLCYSSMFAIIHPCPQSTVSHLLVYVSTFVDQLRSTVRCWTRVWSYTIIVDLCYSWFLVFLFVWVCLLPCAPQEICSLFMHLGQADPPLMNLPAVLPMHTRVSHKPSVFYNSIL